MADKTATLYIRLKDEITVGLEKIRSATRGLTDVYFGLKIALDAANATFGAMARFIGQSLDAYGEHEKAVKGLTLAMKNQGFETGRYKNSLIALSQELQRTTAFSDEA